MQIRPFQESDMEDVFAIFAEVVQGGDTFPFWPDSSMGEARQHWIDVPRATYVAIADGELIGSYYLKDNQPGLGNHVCNAGYMVASRARGLGVGASMCEHSMVEAKGLGYSSMQYNLVLASNEPAVRLWQSMGFEVVGRLPKVFRHSQLGKVDALVMFRNL